MTPKRFLVAAAFLGATALTGAGVATAESTDTPVNPAAQGNLLLTVSTSHGTAQPMSSVFLNCPGHGTHPHATDACTDLATAHGDFDKLPHRQLMCPMYVSPVTATASGVFGGKPVHFTREYANRCLLARSTGAVFNF